MVWIVYGLMLMLVAGAAVAVWMIAIEPRRFRIWRVNIPRTEERSEEAVAFRAGRLPALRVLHITDTHFRAGDGAKLDFLRRTSREPCDLVFLTGDLIETPDGVGPCAEMIDMLRPRLGTYAVLGGHDYFRGTDLLHKYSSLGSRKVPPRAGREANPTEDLRRALESRGVEILDDENRLLRGPKGDRFALVGLRDAFVFECDYEAAWEGVAEDFPTIVIAHSPDVLGEVSRREADLAIFGHTHGGQVRFPLIGAVVTRSRLAPQRARGVFREGKTVFTINQGMGAGWGSNFRLLCPPEVTLLEIE